MVQKTMTNIYLLTTVCCIYGVAKTNIRAWKCSKPYSWFIHILSSKFYLVDIKNPQQNQAKSQISSLQTTYRTPYRQIPLKSSISATSQPKNQTLIPPKIYPQFQNLPYLWTLLPITFFHLKIAPKSSLTTSPTQGVLKNCT